MSSRQGWVEQPKAPGMSPPGSPPAASEVIVSMGRRALDVLCGGQWERPPTTDVLLLELGKMLGGFGDPGVRGRKSEVGEQATR